jgi:hypothetical protein
MSFVGGRTFFKGVITLAVKIIPAMGVEASKCVLVGETPSGLSIKIWERFLRE